MEFQESQREELDSADQANQEQLDDLQAEIQQKMLEAQKMVAKKAMSESGYHSRQFAPDSQVIANSELNTSLVARNNVIHMKNMIIELQEVLATNAKHANEVERLNFMLQNMSQMEHHEVIYFFKVAILFYFSATSRSSETTPTSSCVSPSSSASSRRTSPPTSTSSTTTTTRFPSRP